MTSQFFIPVSSISKMQNDTLELTAPARCSRCDTSPAPFYETHSLRYRAGLVRHFTPGRKFASEIPFRVRLPLCPNCYSSNFIEAPETLTHDSGTLGLIARWRSTGILVASLVAGVGFILLMEILPLPLALNSIERLWSYPMTISAAIFTLTFGLTALQNRRIKKALQSAKYDIKLHRAFIIATTQPEFSAPKDIAVFIEMDNDRWAKECADQNGWEYRIKENQPEKENHP